MTAGGRREGGQASVELVLALPMVVLLLLLVVQVGLVALARVEVVHAAREGARAAAVEGTEAAARSAAVRGLPADQVEVRAEIDRREGGLAEVTVRYRFVTRVPLVGPLVPDPVLTSRVVMRVEGPSAG